MLAGVRYAYDLPTPFASAGASARHAEHSLDEHGMSCLRYSSLTIFCTLPFLVDLTNTLLEMFEAYGSASDRLRLVITANRLSDQIIFRNCSAKFFLDVLRKGTQFMKSLDLSLARL